jgi:hypothetical protein
VIDRAAGEPALGLADLRLVEWDLLADTPRGKTPSTTRELVPAADVPLLVEALVKLHHDPGVNPHNGNKTARLVRVRVGTPSLGDGYWWTGPTLEDDGPRARVVTWRFDTAWDGAGPPPDEGDLPPG